MKEKIVGINICMLVFIASTIVITNQAIAHPPENIDLYYGLSTQELNATITHITVDPNNHYVNKVEVYKNNVRIIQENYTSQPSNTFTLFFTFSASIADSIMVEASDNLGYKTQKEIIVTDDSPNNPPTTPTINGQTNGKINTMYNYTVVSTDPDNDSVYYFIDWGDGTSSGWIGPYASGVILTQPHSWTKKGTYIIKTKAKDTYGNESGWGQLSIKMPYKPPHFRLFENLILRYPNSFPILRHLLGY